MRNVLLLLGILILVVGCSPTGSSETGSAVQTSDASFGLGKGQIPPDFTLETVDGLTVSLRDFQKQGKPVLVYFLATWCPYCRKDFTTLSEVYKTYENDVPIIAVSLDLKEDAPLLREYRSQYPGLEDVMFAPGETALLKNYQVKFTTTKYALGKDGRILYAGSGPFSQEQWNVLLDAMRAS